MAKSIRIDPEEGNFGNWNENLWDKLGWGIRMDIFYLLVGDVAIGEQRYIEILVDVGVCTKNYKCSWGSFVKHRQSRWITVVDRFFVLFRIILCRVTF